MKKRLLVLIILFVYFKTEAQDQYYFQFNLNIEYTLNCANETQDGQTINVSVLNQSNGLITDYDVDLVNLPLTYNNGNEVYTFTSTIATLNQRPYRVVANYTAVCEDQDNGSTTANAYNFDLVFNHGNFHDYDIQDTNTGIGIFTSIDATTGPVLNTPDDSNICTNDLIFTDVDYTEAPEFVNGLTWYYFNINTQWVELNNFSNFYPLKYSVEDIIGIDYFSLIGANSIKLRYTYQYTSSSQEIISNEIIIDVTEKSPEITSFTTTNPLCSYAPLNLGNFTVTFDRALNSGETLRILTLTHDGPDGVLNTPDDVGLPTLTDISYTGTTFTWPNLLPADQYRLSYQSGYISPMDILNCLEEYSPIIINTPVPVTFSAGWTDVDCFGEDTGSISITASGGTGNYEYSINNGVHSSGK